VRLVNPGEHQLRELRERRIDLLITRTTDQSASEDLHSELLFDEPFVFVIGAESEFARRRRVVLGDIIGCKWVLPAPDSARGALIDGVAGFQPPKAVVKTLSIELTTSLVASGEFVGTLPISVARLKAGQASLRVLPVKSVGPRISAELVFVIQPDHFIRRLADLVSAITSDRDFDGPDCDIDRDSSDPFQRLRSIGRIYYPEPEVRAWGGEKFSSGLAARSYGPPLLLELGVPARRPPLAGSRSKTLAIPLIS